MYLYDMLVDLSVYKCLRVWVLLISFILYYLFFYKDSQLPSFMKHIEQYDRDILHKTRVSEENRFN